MLANEYDIDRLADRLSLRHHPKGRIQAMTALEKIFSQRRSEIPELPILNDALPLGHGYAYPSIFNKDNRVVVPIDKMHRYMANPRRVRLKMVSDELIAYVVYRVMPQLGLEFDTEDFSAKCAQVMLKAPGGHEQAVEEIAALKRRISARRRRNLQAMRAALPVAAL